MRNIISALSVIISINLLSSHLMANEVCDFFTSSRENLQNESLEDACVEELSLMRDQQRKKTRKQKRN